MGALSKIFKGKKPPMEEEDPGSGEGEEKAPTPDAAVEE